MTARFPLAVLLTSVFSYTAMTQKPIYQNKAFALYSDKVVQDKFTARVLSAQEVQSDYDSPTNLYQPATIKFKFAINGKDNEMAPGVDHEFTVAEGVNETMLISFGRQMKKVAATDAYLKPDMPLLVRLDMREVLKQMNEKGYYTTFKGEQIFKQDFKGVYIAGGTPPMIWDFDNVANNPKLQLHDHDGDGIYEVKLILNSSADKKKIDAYWKLSKDLSAYPQYSSPYVVSDALYNLSMEEMLNAVEPDSTLRTGKEWAGVWTRDVSYSIILAMAHLQPRVAQNSLLRKVNARMRIIQDTGTGGAWPASTDRMIWAVAAWEIYKVTGDKDWLQLAFEVIKNSIEDDMAVAYDAATGLVKGESSFLDWREQTYPKWMQPADIFESFCLGTNAVHYQANKLLAQMAAQLGRQEVVKKHEAAAEKIKAGINKHLWLPKQNYYAQFLYGRNYKMVSPRSEALGEALCVLWDIADNSRQQMVVQNTPVNDFGIPCIHPQIPNIPPYHNEAVWPFVQSFWMWAAAKTGNEQSVMESIAAIYRPAALFATNKENFVAGNGDFSGTVINSSNMLWSLSGNISMVHKLFFGIRFEPDALRFAPFVPKAFGGNRALTNFKYRNAVLDISMSGFGNRIAVFEFDGKAQKDFMIPATITGKHTVKIVLANNDLPAQKTNRREVEYSLPAPQVELVDGELKWPAVPNAAEYLVLKNGKEIARTSQNHFAINATGPFAEYQVMAIDQQAVASFASEPVAMDKQSIIVQAEHAGNVAKGYDYKGYEGNGFIELSRTINQLVSMEVEVNEAGIYSIDFRYANGNGPTNTENKCAIRTLKVNGEMIGAMVFPQRGKNEWSNWGYSNVLHANLKKGKNKIELVFEPANENMNGEINQAMLDLVRVVKL